MSDQFFDVDGKLERLTKKVEALEAMPMMKQASAAPGIIADIIALIADLRNEMRPRT